MQFYSETYHESTQYAPRSVGDPISLHWESAKLLDKRFLGLGRYPISESHLPIHSPNLADGIQSVAVYAVVRNGIVPDGVYYFDIGKKELVNIGGKQMMRDIAKAFPEREFVEQAEILYLYTGLMDRSVWRFREAAYRQVQMDVGAACANTMLFAKSQGKKVFPLGAFVDDALAVALGLGAVELPLAAMALFPENSMVAFNSFDDGVGEFAYSNRNEIQEMGSRYAARFLLQNRCECINDLDRCLKVRRVSVRALPGDEFPLTPSKFPTDHFLREIWYLKENQKPMAPFVPSTMDLDDFSTMLRYLESGQLNAFGAGLLKIWVVVFDVMFVYSGVYRYVPVQKSIYMQSGIQKGKKFPKCFMTPEQAQNASFAVIFTADIKDAVNVLGERAYRYLNLNAGFLAETLDLASRFLNKQARSDHFFFHDELKNFCSIPEQESVISAVIVGKK